MAFAAATAMLLSSLFPCRAADFLYTSDATGSLRITRYTGVGGAVVIPMTIDGRAVTTLGGSAFKGVFSLSSVSIPPTVTMIEDEAFYGCTALTNVVLPSGLRYLGRGAFRECTSLTQVTIPKSTSAWLGDSRLAISGEVFAYCTGLTNVVLGDGNQPAFILDAAFVGCSNLVSVSAPKGFAGVVGGQAFSGCAKLERVVLNPSLEEIRSFAFLGCRSLTAIEIPDSVISIGDNAFQFCAGLTNVIVGGNPVSPYNTTVGKWAFGSCTNLTRVKMGARLGKLDDWAFLECTALRSIAFKGDAPALGFGVFAGCSATAYYTDAGTGWGADLGGIPSMLWNATMDQIAATSSENGIGFAFRIQGSRKLRVVVESSSDLMAWEPSETVSLADGPASVNLTTPPAQSRRFYRLQTP